MGIVLDNRSESPNITRDSAADQAAPGAVQRWLASGRRLPPAAALLAMVGASLVLWVFLIHLFRLLSH
jgi:hypothetical protein